MRKEKINELLQKIRNLFFLILFFSSIVMLFIYISTIKEQQESSLIENRYLETFTNFNEVSFLDSSFQNKLENAIKDQFVKRYEIVNLKKKSDIKTTSLLKEEEEVVEEIDDSVTEISDTGLLQVGNSNYVILGLVEENETYKERYIERANEINQLAQDYPDINVYVYYPTQAHETSLFDDEETGRKSYGPFYYELYSDALKVKHSRLEINSVNEYKNYYYEQDHHWNYAGSYQGYLDILDLITEGKETPLEPENLVTSDDQLWWSGTMGSRTGYIFNYEEFLYYTYDLKEYRVYVDGVEQPVGNMNNVMEQINGGQGYYYTCLGANNFYNEEFVTSYPEKESLLIIGDSYASAVEPLLCQHFSKIYFIQPSNYRWLGNNGIPFNIDEFLLTHDVDNILFMYTGENYFLDDTYDNFMLHRGEN